jgi:hypothetical protein
VPLCWSELQLAAPVAEASSLRAHQLPMSRSIRLNRSSPTVHACRCAAALVRISPKLLPWLTGVWPAPIRVRSYRHRRVVAGDSFACASNSRVESFSCSPVRPLGSLGLNPHRVVDLVGYRRSSSRRVCSSIYVTLLYRRRTRHPLFDPHLTSSLQTRSRRRFVWRQEIPSVG